MFPAVTPVLYRIDYKVIQTVYKSLHEQAPSYLLDVLCKVPGSGYRLRSRTENNLIVPFTKHKTFADRAFSVRGPKLWNDLPEYLKNQESMEVFKKELKTLIFKKAFRL